MITDNCQTYVRDFFDFLMVDGEPDAVNKLPRKQSPFSSEMEKEEVEASPPGLHKLCYPTIRDRSTRSKFGAHGEHEDVFLFSNLGAL